MVPGVAQSQDAPMGEELVSPCLSARSSIPEEDIGKGDMFFEQVAAKLERERALRSSSPATEGCASPARSASSFVSMSPRSGGAPEPLLPLSMHTSLRPG